MIEILEAMWRAAVARGDNPKKEADLAERLHKARVIHRRRVSVHRMLAAGSK